MIEPDLNIKHTRTLSDKYLMIHNPEFYEFITNKYNSFTSSSWKEKLYMYKMNMSEPHKCPVCGKYTRFINYTVGYAEHCSSRCSNSDPDKLKTQHGTMMKRYGVTSPSQLQDYSMKVKQTKLERYGDENYSNRDKARETKLELYGDEHYTNIEKMKMTKLKRYGDEYYTNRDKSKQTTLERYGAECPFGVKDFREKAKQTKFKRYGNEHYFDVSKMKKTLLEKYGTDNYSNSNKVKQTKLERYGNENYNNHDKAALTFKQTVIERTPELINYSDTGDWIIKCPHKECNKCEDKFFVTPRTIYYDRTRLGIEPCTKLFPIYDHGGTSLELFVRDILDELHIEYQTNVRDIISPKELDIYIPSKHIAIECNGVFYHSTQLARSYKQHEEKWQLCKDKDIQLITVWEDWIKNKPDIVKSVIINKLGVCDRSIPARKCKIQEISSSDCMRFLNDNHIQGGCKSGIRLGLTYCGELVSVMTFNKKRGMMGNNKSVSNEYELSRFCNLLNTRVIGAASKLLKYFKTHYEWSSIYSFSSNDISDGGLYKTLGFGQAGNINHCYWYVDKDMRRHHRSEYSKSNIIRMGIKPDKNGWTENEVTKELGLFKIYDSGQQKWILNNV